MGEAEAAVLVFFCDPSLNAAFLLRFLDIESEGMGGKKKNEPLPAISGTFT